MAGTTLAHPHSSRTTWPRTPLPHLAFHHKCAPLTPTPAIEAPRVHPGTPQPPVTTSPGFQSGTAINVWGFFQNDFSCMYARVLHYAAGKTLKNAALLSARLSLCPGALRGSSIILSIVIYRRGFPFSPSKLFELFERLEQLARDSTVGLLTRHVRAEALAARNGLACWLLHKCHLGAWDHPISSSRFNSNITTLNFSTGHFWPVVKILLKIGYVVSISRFLS